MVFNKMAVAIGHHVDMRLSKIQASENRKLTERQQEAKKRGSEVMRILYQHCEPSI